MADFLFEIGLEEVPARMIAGAQAELLRRVLAMLARHALLSPDFDPLTDAQSYSTPRRLAVLVRGVLDRQDDLREDVVGPAVKIAFKDGKPTPAAEAFARKNGVAVDELRTVQAPKGEYLSATSLKKGRSAAEVIADELPKELAAIYWAKNMYWRPGKPERFVRPVLWMLCLLGEDVVPVQFAGRTAERVSFGHRVLSSGDAFEIQAPSSYLAQLEGEYVMADVEARRHRIRKALDHATRRVANVRWREDEALVDGVTHLTEWPDVLLGNFESEYLALPEEVLVTVMRDHQKYFAVEDAKGKLAPHFLAVLNIALSGDNEAIIRQGNERVLRARFNDARFFWEFDQRVPLAERVSRLENVIFQKDLGSYAAKSMRVRTIAAKLAQIADSLHPTVPGHMALDLAAIDEAAMLAKTDLTTELVKEFTELQGIIGGLYARSQGARGVVADAIYDQYLPAGMEDGVPRTLEGAILGLADRVDTIAGMFGLGMEPTGSKDPFALRRAANGIVKILAETALDLNLDAAIGAASNAEETAGKLRAFFKERLEFYLRDVRGFAYDVVTAVVAVENNVATFNNVRDAIARAEALTAVRGGENFAAVSAAFKRMKNILAQAGFVLPAVTVLATDSFGRDDAEGRLAKKAFGVAEEVQSLRERREYAAALALIATIRPEVDTYFESVMIMDPDLEVREGRLTLLAMILRSFSSIADFSEIVTA
jgi:glycyl-tRNA synthetase beta chain